MNINSKIAFGTSGLRGLADDFDRPTVGAYVRAFLDHVGARAGNDVFVGCDLRASSPEISAHVVSAIAAREQVPVWCGVLPTPAVAAAALARGVPAIITTGSHIPENYNGIKFYRPDGELLKDDETPIRTRVAIASAEDRPDFAETALPEPDMSAGATYVARYLDAFGPKALSGLRIGLFEHSAAGRDLLAEILSGLGAELHRFGRSARFVAVDTEALDPAGVEACAAEIAGHGLDAVVSTDGDGDRPLLIAADGRQVNGDVLCTLAARALGIRTVVTPLTSTSAIERTGWFRRIVRTRIGSPYVVAAMQAEKQGPLAGFEANGGFLLGSALDLPGGTLSPLPTRDAVLPLVAVLAETRRRSMTLADLCAEMPPRVMKADRLKEIPRDLSTAFLGRIAEDRDLRKDLAADLENPTATDRSDGLRFTLANDSIVHFRASGNAPELRVYVETDSAEDTDRRLHAIMGRLEDVLSHWPNNSGRDGE